jgi:Tfp pilus assembly protein PilN
MIKVNLIGTGRKKAKAGAKIALPATFTPVLLLVIALGFAGAGYWWYSSLSDQLVDLTSKIKQAQAQKAALDKVIQADQIYESRKKILALDQLSAAVDRTQYVWLSNLDQNNAILSMNGTGTSLNAIADFYTNLTSTGYFKNIDVSNAQDTNGNYSFSLKCEFAPRPPTAAGQTAAVETAGGN